MPPMSMAIAEPAMNEAVEDPEDMPDGLSSRGIALSAALHVVMDHDFVNVASGD